MNYTVNASWLARSLGEQTTREELVKRRMDVEMLERRGVISRKPGAGRPPKHKEKTT